MEDLTNDLDPYEKAQIIFENQFNRLMEENKYLNENL